jgi:hypothetical protein
VDLIPVSNNRSPGACGRLPQGDRVRTAWSPQEPPPYGPRPEVAAPVARTEGESVAKKIVIVCDVCGREEDVKRFTLSHGGETVRPELCRDHAAPLAPSSGSPPRPRKPRRKQPERSSTPCAPAPGSRDRGRFRVRASGYRRSSR